MNGWLTGRSSARVVCYHSSTRPALVSRTGRSESSFAARFPDRSHWKRSVLPLSSRRVGFTAFRFSYFDFLLDCCTWPFVTAHTKLVVQTPAGIPPSFFLAKTSPSLFPPRGPSCFSSPSSPVSRFSVCVWRGEKRAASGRVSCQLFVSEAPTAARQPASGSLRMLAGWASLFS